MIVNPKWYLILQVVRELNDRRYALSVGRTLYPKICYVLTRNGVEVMDWKLHWKTTKKFEVCDAIQNLAMLSLMDISCTDAFLKTLEEFQYAYFG